MDDCVETQAYLRLTVRSDGIPNEILQAVRRAAQDQYGEDNEGAAWAIYIDTDEVDVLRHPSAWFSRPAPIG